MIKRDEMKIAQPGLNPAAGVMEETLEHYGITQARASAAMKINPSYLNEVLKNKKGMSAELALRFQRCVGVPADYLIRLQASHDFKKAYHAKSAVIGDEVEILVSPAA